MKRAYIYLIFIFSFVFLGCNGQKKEKIIYRLGTEQGKILYSGISNAIFFDTYPKESIPIKLQAVENCTVKGADGLFYISPNDSVQYAVVELTFPDSLTSNMVVFPVKNLPEPRIYYTDDLNDTYKLANFISKANIHYLFYLEAKSEIGYASWLAYKIKEFEIIIIKNNNSVERFKNIGEKMSLENQNMLQNLCFGDIILFRNIVLTTFTSDKKIIINEKSMTIQ